MNRLRVHCYLVLDVCEPITFCRHHRPVLHDRKRKALDALPLNLDFDEIIDFGGGVVLRNTCRDMKQNQAGENYEWA